MRTVRYTKGRVKVVPCAVVRSGTFERTLGELCSYEFQERLFRITKVTTLATAQKIRNVLATVRDARSMSPAPSEREFTEAPPAPAVVATAPSAISTGAMIDAPAAASAPTPVPGRSLGGR
jgi:hypothetical protein